MADELVRVELRGAAVELVLNRPDKRNALNWELMEALDRALAEAARAEGARAVLLRGEGKCFSAGLDLSAFLGMSARLGERWRDNLLPLTRTFQGILDRVEQCSLPVIALLHGHCLGLGLELALACDLRLAAEGTAMALPEAKLGLIPDVGGTTRLTRLLGPARAKELILTARTVSLDEAERWGLVNRVLPAEGLLDAGLELAEQIAGCAPLAVAFGKQVVDAAWDLSRGLNAEALAQATLIKTEDMMAGAMAMMSKQTPRWKGK